jgi:SAM-dependent methyltransferase
MVKRRRLIERYCSSGSILDIGCATGNFLAEMSSSGRWVSIGIEPDPAAADVARTRHHLDVRVGPSSAFEFAAGSLQVVTLWNVLEHLHEPIDELRRLHRWLAPGGHVVFSIPNLESFEVRLFRDRWYGWDLPRHLYQFPRPVLDRILDDLGFEIVHVLSLSGSQFGFAGSLRHFFGSEPSSPTWNRQVASLVVSPIGRIALFPLFYAISELRQSFVLTYVARKRL